MTRYAKALTAFVTALGTWGATAAADGRYAQDELWGLTGVLVAALAVFQVPNRPPRGRRRRADVSEQEGHADPLGLLVVAVFVILLVLALTGRLG